MGFCPECRSEYVSSVQQCPACGVGLVSELAEGTPEELVGVYACTDVLEANLVKETLEAEGIEATVLSREDRAFPATGVQSGYRVAVMRSQREPARTLLEEAMASELFGASGELV